MAFQSTGRAIPPLSILAAFAFLLIGMAAGAHFIGLPPVVIVGGSGAVGMVGWLWSYSRGPIAPATILPPFLLTVACVQTHMVEEYLTGFGPAMSRVFDISWTERGFVLAFAFIGPALYTLTALGLYLRRPFAGFMAWFIFIGPGVAEFTHFIFPLLRPAILPADPEVVSRVVSNGNFVQGMANYFIGTTGHYYFPGMYTAVLPMIPGIYGLWAVCRARRQVTAVRVPSA